MEKKKNIALRVLAVVGGILASGLVVVLVMAGLGPETFVVAGRQLPKRYVRQIRDLGLLDEGERIAFFYSDAFSDIRGGLYFVSDRKLAAYSEDWDPPGVTVPFEEIADLSVEYVDSTWEDSVIWVRTKDEQELAIPVSHERGGDRQFFEYLSRMWTQARPADPEGGAASSGATAP